MGADKGSQSQREVDFTITEETGSIISQGEEERTRLLVGEGWRVVTMVGGVRKEEEMDHRGGARKWERTVEWSFSTGGSWTVSMSKINKNQNHYEMLKCTVYMYIWNTFGVVTSW